jgi:hypothetical protein
LDIILEEHDDDYKDKNDVGNNQLTMTQINVQSIFCGPYVAMFNISFKK